MTTAMRPFSSTISLAEAQAIVADAARPVDRRETLDLFDATGRVLTSSVTADHDVPSFDRSAMDGYAVRAADTEGAAPDRPARLTPVGASYTGHAPGGAPIAAGQCREIATGAPLPPGADAVVMVEDTEPDDEAVAVRREARPGQHVVSAGSDVRAGQLVAAAGDLLTPARIGAVAAVGIAAVEVYARPIVAIVSTGNEVVPPGTALAPGQVHDINRYTLSAVVWEHGGVPRIQPTAPDALDELRGAFAAVAEADVIVFSGGSSVGTRDLVQDLIREHGEMLFHGVAIKPGKPTAFARAGRALIFGMPGNPASCLSNAYVLLAPLLRRMARLPARVARTVTARLASDVRSTPDRHQFFTVTLVDGRAEPAFKGSGDITSLSRADGFIEIPVGVDRVAAGTTVEVTLY